MERSFSKNKDVDREILQRLEDRDLFNTLLTNKYSYDITNNDNFWRNRLLLKYPVTIPYKPENFNWKDYYLSVVYYIDKLKKEKNFDFKEGDPRFLYKLLVVQQGKREHWDIVNELFQNGYPYIALDVFNSVRLEDYLDPLTMEQFIRFRSFKY
jgi:hypothetical protein